MKSVSKDIHNLLRCIKTLSDDQAEVLDIQTENDTNTIFISVVPNGGLYCGGQFIFKIHLRAEYPMYFPEVFCLTPIYHPNIDNILVFDESEADICINLLTDWESTFDLEHVIQAILFLLYQPNLEDPICVMFEPNMDKETYVENVRTSLEGGLVDGIMFPSNKAPRKEKDTHHNCESTEIKCSVNEVIRSERVSMDNQSKNKHFTEKKNNVHSDENDHTHISEANKTI